MISGGELGCNRLDSRFRGNDGRGYGNDLVNRAPPDLGLGITARIRERRRPRQPLHRRRAAVYYQLAARHVGRLVGRQKQHAARHVFHFA